VCVCVCVCALECVCILCSIGDLDSSETETLISSRKGSKCTLFSLSVTPIFANTSTPKCFKDRMCGCVYICVCLRALVDVVVRREKLLLLAVVLTSESVAVCPVGDGRVNGEGLRICPLAVLSILIFASVCVRSDTDFAGNSVPIDGESVDISLFLWVVVITVFVEGGVYGRLDDTMDTDAGEDVDDE